MVEENRMCQSSCFLYFQLFNRLIKFDHFNCLPLVVSLVIAVGIFIVDHLEKEKEETLG